MHQPIILPDLGADSAVLSAWFADLGEAVYEGDRLVEISVGSATFDVSSPATGKLLARLARPNEPLNPGQILGLVDVPEVPN